MIKAAVTDPGELCVGCGYDVSSLPDAEQCPECGFDIGWGRSHALSRATPGSLSRLRSGLGLFAWSVTLGLAGLVAALLFGVVGFEASGSIDEREARAAGVFLLLTSVLWHVGLFRLAPLDLEAPGHTSGAMAASARNALAMLVLTIAVVAGFPFDVVRVLLLVLSPVLIIFEFRASVSLHRFFAPLARRVPDRRLYRRAARSVGRLQRWCGTGLAIAYLGFGLAALVDAAMAGVVDDIVWPFASYLAVQAFGTIWFFRMFLLVSLWRSVRRIESREAAA